MYPTRAHIGDHGSHARGKLLLQIQIPLDYVIAFWVWLGVSGTQPVRTKDDILATKVGKRIRTWRGRIAGSRGILNHGVLKEWHCLGGQKDELVGQRLDIEHPDSPADGSFSIPQWIPCKAEAWLKVLQRGVVEKGISQVGRGICDVPQVRELAAGLAYHGRHFVA